VRCAHLTRRFGDRTAVDDVSFEIARGQTYGLLGPNGAGKTTTISMVAGILAPDAGEIWIEGRRVTPTAGEAKGRIGLVPQEIALYDDLTAAENLAFFGRLQGLGGAALKARIAAVLDTVGLADRAGDRIDRYSGGMKRRANIAVGLLHEPALLILDEPTVGVDPQSRNQILEAIEALGREGLGVLYTTHYMEEAERLCDRVAIMDEGRIVAEGTHRELVAQVGEHDRVLVRGTGDLAAFARRVRSRPGVLAAEVVGDLVEVHTAEGAAALAGIVSEAGQDGIEISALEMVQPDLESVFLHLTGKALRDG
jgi:ABC-2 type transport system ATP-binding protein